MLSQATNGRRDRAEDFFQIRCLDFGLQEIQEILLQGRGGRNLSCQYAQRPIQMILAAAMMRFADEYDVARRQKGLLEDSLAVASLPQQLCHANSNVTGRYVVVQTRKKYPNSTAP